VAALWVDATAACSFLARLRSIAAAPCRALAADSADFRRRARRLLLLSTIMGRDPGVTLLVLLLFLKLLETRAQRDVFVVAFLVYFVVLATFSTPSIPIAVLMLLTVFPHDCASRVQRAQRPIVDG